MREYKFRAWEDVNKLMYPLKSIPVEMLNSGGDVIMQFTGLEAKGGVEIYEGDILKDKGVMCIVAFKWNGWTLLNMDNDSQFSNNFAYAQCCEVVGNIYENKELLNNGGKD